MIKVQVPATSANLGPGFDSLGLALSLYASISAEERENGFVIEGCDIKFANENNLVLQGFNAALQYAEKEGPKGLYIKIESDIPVSRGLGSSAAMVVGGIQVANDLCSLNLTKEDMLKIATKIEGHPDNAAPAIYGGLCASAMIGDEIVCVNYPVSSDICFAALVPDFETETRKARELLPKKIDRLDAVYTVSALALLPKAMETGDTKLLGAALNDKLHQPYRALLIPGFEEIKDRALALGASGLVISGSGSTLLCVYSKTCEGFADKLRDTLKKFDGNWKVLELEPVK